jgi:hypothetical protein
MAIQPEISYDGVGPAEGRLFSENAERILRQRAADRTEQEDRETWISENV